MKTEPSAVNGLYKYGTYRIATTYMVEVGWFTVRIPPVFYKK